MIENLQAVLDEFEELKALTEKQATNLLEKSIEIDKLKQKAIEADKLYHQAQRSVALGNANSRLQYKIESQDIEIAKLKEKSEKLARENKALLADNPKKLKEQIKRLKAKNIELTKVNDRVNNDNKQCKREVSLASALVVQLRQQIAISQITNTGKNTPNNLWLIPDRITVAGPDGKPKSVVSLWYRDQEGVGYLLTLHDDKLYGMGARFNLPEMPADLFEKAQSWLQKVAAQDYQITDADYAAFAGFSMPDSYESEPFCQLRQYKDSTWE